MKKRALFIFLMFLSFQVLAQDKTGENLYLLEGDSIPQYGISLKEVVVFQPLRFKSREELKRYVILRRRVFRVYPYAKLAAERLTVLNERLENIESKRGRKKYLKRLEKFIYENATGWLKHFMWPTTADRKCVVTLLSVQALNLLWLFLVLQTQQSVHALH